MKELLNNEKFVWVAMGVLIVLITQGFKWLVVKRFTNKLPDKVRTIINSTIVIVAIGLGFVAEYFYSFKYLGKPFDVLEALGWSGAGQVVYSIVERIFKLIGSKVTIENPFTTEEGKQVLNLAEKVTKDGKLDQSDMPCVEEFLKSLENIKQ